MSREGNRDEADNKHEWLRQECSGRQKRARWCDDPDCGLSSVFGYPFNDPGDWPPWDSLSLLPVTRDGTPGTTPPSPCSNTPHLGRFVHQRLLEVRLPDVIESSPRVRLKHHLLINSHQLGSVWPRFSSYFVGPSFFGVNSCRSRDCCHCLTRLVADNLIDEDNAPLLLLLLWVLLLVASASFVAVVDAPKVVAVSGCIIIYIFLLFSLVLARLVG